MGKIRTILFFLICAMVAVTFSCNGNKDGKKKNKINFRIRERIENDELEDFDNLNALRDTNDRICVLFGYGYNSPEIVSKLKADLSSRFGLHEDGGLIAPIVFPDDFRRETRAVPSDLYEILSEFKKNYNFHGVILLGAPERTNIAISKLQDDDEESYFPTISFFSQDDILATQATSDLVIDKAMNNADSESVVEVEVNQAFENDIVEILSSTVRYIYTLEKPLEKNAETLQAAAQKIMAKKKVDSLVDPETGFRPLNHFVFN